MRTSDVEFQYALLMTFFRLFLGLFCRKKEQRKNFVCLTKNMGYPLTQIPKIATFQNRYLHSLKSLSIKLQHDQKFQNLFFRKINKEKISYF